MKQFKTITMLSAAVLMGFAAPSFAQDTDMIKDKAIDMAKDKVKDKATDMATKKAGDMGGTVAGKGVDMGADMMKGKSAKDAAMDAAMDSGKDKVKSETGMTGGALGAVLGTTSGTDMATDAVGSMSTDEKMKAGKIMLKGGSAQDAATAVAKDRAKDKMMGTAKGMLTKKMSGETASTMETAPMMEAAPAPTTVMVSCPAGTTAQPNGTCMITGDYDGGN